MHNATKFTDAQILLTIILSSFAGVKRLIRMASFSYDALVMALLGLPEGLNKDVISTRLKALGQAGAIYLQEHLFGLVTQWLTQSQLERLTIDADWSTATKKALPKGTVPTSAEPRVTIRCWPLPAS